MAYNRNNLDFGRVFDAFRGQDLPRSIKFINAIGKTAASVLLIAVLTATVLHGNQIAISIAATSFGIMALCLGIVGASSIGRSNNRTTVGSQFAYTLLRVLLFLFVPAILLTAGLFITLWL